MSNIFNKIESTRSMNLIKALKNIKSFIFHHYSLFSPQPWNSTEFKYIQDFKGSTGEIKKYLKKFDYDLKT